MLSEHYDDIFPVKSSAVRLINHHVRLSGPVIDVACGTGNEAIELVQAGIYTIGIDLNEALIAKAKAKAFGFEAYAKFFSMDMLNLKDLPVSNASVMYCIGNSIVHLSSFDELRSFLDQAFVMLDDGATLIIQTVNMDRMLNQKVHRLGDIHCPESELTFERFYIYQDHYIEFSGVLRTNQGTFQSRTNLLPVTSDDWRELIYQSPFSSIDIYGDFDLNPFTFESPALIAIINK